MRKSFARRIASLCVAVTVLVCSALFYQPQEVRAVGTDEMVFNVDFRTFSGDQWTVTDDNYLSSNYFTILRDPDNNGYWYEVTYSNGNTFTYGDENNPITNDDAL